MTHVTNVVISLLIRIIGSDDSLCICNLYSYCIGLISSLLGLLTRGALSNDSPSLETILLRLLKTERLFCGHFPQLRHHLDKST